MFNLNVYDARRYGTIAFLAVCMVVVAGFLYYSSQLVKDLSRQERAHMQIWADATRELSSLGVNGEEPGNVDFLLSIIEENRTIPVLLTDDQGTIIMNRNFDLPEPSDPNQPLYISPANKAFLQSRLDQLEHTPNVIHIIIAPGVKQHLYYEDSKLLKSLSFYPYVQVLVLIAFILVVYYALRASNRSEQNKVWVGLSKETAHQLGTPISSLMAWLELLKESGTDPEMVSEMDKDVKRLSMIASRFSKIGSRPALEHCDLNEAVSRAVEYMQTRISSHISLTIATHPGSIPVMLSQPLVEWVMENLIKNAVDAMKDGRGTIHVTTGVEGKDGFVEVHDSGKGLSRKRFKTIFNPGFTTKKRGWGLGLTLAKRIIEEYHNGKIYVKDSELGQGTTFRIEFPLVKESTNTK